jgi:hypothetical protein
VASLITSGAPLALAAIGQTVIIVVGGFEGADASMLAHVVLSGRLALSQPVASPADAHAVAEFVAANYERYRARPVVRDELDAMAIVARWLSERDSADGRLVHLRGPNLDPAALRPGAAGTEAAEIAHS